MIVIYAFKRCLRGARSWRVERKVLCTLEQRPGTQANQGNIEAEVWGKRDLTSLCNGPIRSCVQLPGPTTNRGGHRWKLPVQASILYKPDRKLKPIQANLLLQSIACIHKPRGALTAFKRLPSMWDDEDNSIPSPALNLLALPHLTHYPLQIPMAPLSAATPKHPI